MTTKPFTSALRIAALFAACLLQAPAQAGLVSGSWDPAFGPALPGLNWAVQATLNVPNACANGADGAQATGGPCNGAQLLTVTLDLFNSDPLDPQRTTYSVINPCQVPNCGNLQAIKLYQGNVIGLEASIAQLFQASLVGPSSALQKTFSLAFTLERPILTCLDCDYGPVESSGDGLRQFLTTYTSNDNSVPKFVDDAGNALGVRLDQAGRVLGQATTIGDPLQQQVPEPGSLALVAVALAAAALARRRRG